MTHEEKIQWMALWAAKNGLQLVLEGECGFGRECVGVMAHDNYPDYQWHNDETYEREDANGDVWTPPDAYHKHTCIAVLGRGEKAEGQLYDWLKWFESNEFALEVVDRPVKNAIELMMGRHLHVRMAKQ